MTEPTVVHPAVPVLETKLRRPTVSSLHVARQRLLVQLTASLEHRLILVSAPAGYGKTALVSRWLDTVDRPCAWFSVDEHDDDLATFLIYLAAAIRTVAQDALGALELLLSAPTLPAPHRLADTLLQDLAALPGPLILALDDYHTVNAPEIHALMVRLVERLPAHVHLVLITRADPPLPLDRLRGRQELGELRAANLRFSAAETRLLLQRMLGPEITAETAALLEESTEGGRWVCTWPRSPYATAPTRQTLRATLLSTATRPSRSICSPRCWRVCPPYSATVCCRAHCSIGSAHP